MEYALSIVVWAAVPALVAVGLIGLGIWAIRTSRGDVSRAVGILVIAFGMATIGFTLMTAPYGTVEIVETSGGLDAASLAATVVNAPDPQAAFDSLTLPEQIAVADALAEGVLVTTTEVETVPRPEGSQRPAIEPESGEEGPVGGTE